jgi:hypothetical protein
MSEPIRRRRRLAVTLSLGPQHLAIADRYADTLTSEGWSQSSNRSYVVRTFILSMDEVLRGRSPDEIVRYFAEARRRRPRPAAVSSVAPGPAKVSG